MWKSILITEKVEIGGAAAQIELRGVAEIWAELGDEFPDIFDLCSAHSRECSHGPGNETPHDSGRRGEI